MQPSTEKKLNLVLNFILIIIGIAALYFFVIKLFNLFLPFILGLAVAYAVDPIISFLTKKLKFRRQFVSILAIIITIVSVVSGVLYLVYRIMSELISFTRQLPITHDTILNMAENLIDKWEILLSSLPLYMSDAITYALSAAEQSFVNIAQTAARSAINYAGSFATALPEIIIFIIVFILASIFISSDKEAIAGFFEDVLPESLKGKIKTAGKYLKRAVSKYLRAVGILMLITFAELSLGLSLIGVKYALLFAAIIAVVDALPVFGSGTVLVPWALFSFLTGDIKLGIELAVLYVIVYIVRQLLESRVVSSQIGIPPILTLISIYVGYKLIGVFGMIIAPITVVCIVSFYSASAFGERQRRKKEEREAALK